MTTDKSAAIRVKAAEVAAAVAGSIVPVEYFQGSAKHEASYAVNEVDTEPSGFKSYGIFQISQEEGGRFGGLGNWWELDDAARVFVPLAESNMRQILTWTGKTMDEAGPDLWRYLALYHNQGGNAVKKTLDQYGYNWSGPGGYAARNAGASIVKYAADCVPGFSLSKVFDAADESPGSFVGGLIIAGLLGGAIWWALERRRRRGGR